METHYHKKVLSNRFVFSIIQKVLRKICEVPLLCPKPGYNLDIA